jgi:hypothetical protein
MNCKKLTLIILGLMSIATTPALAIAPSNDLIIPGAARTSLWVDDLYIVNPGTTTVSVEIFWLRRNQANPSPESRSFSIAPNETLILPDVILNTFGKTTANGAFRITADGGEVVANMIAVAVIDDENGRRTLGSGFEAIPTSAATAAGGSTTLMGLVATSGFRTNLFATAGAGGVTMHLDLLDPAGSVIDTRTVTLEGWEPYLKEITRIWDISTLENGTALVRVESGSVAILGSKIDNHELSQDPTTLEPAFGGGSGSVDGIYEFSVYDPDGSWAWATGGNLVITAGFVDQITGTYFNYQKGGGECTDIIPWGAYYGDEGAGNPAPAALADFASGVSWTDVLDQDEVLTWTLTITMDGTEGFSGTLDLEGSDFTGASEGCNGTFPTLNIFGGKSP